MLLAKTLRSSTFKVALICIAGFGAVVIGLFGFVYSSTASYVLIHSDRAIDADHVILIAAYAARRTRRADRDDRQTRSRSASEGQHLSAGRCVVRRRLPATSKSGRRRSPGARGGATSTQAIRSRGGRSIAAAREIRNAGGRLAFAGGKECQRFRSICPNDLPRLGLGRRADIHSCGGGRHHRDAAHRRPDRIHQRHQPGHHAKRA